MEHCLHFEPTPGGAGTQDVSHVQPTPDCWKCLFTSEADQREKITASASHSHPCQLFFASLTLCRASGPTFVALHLSIQQRLRCFSCSRDQGISSNPHTHPTDLGENRNLLLKVNDSTKSPSGEVPADSRTIGCGRHSKSQHWRYLSPGWDMRGHWGPITETYGLNIPARSNQSCVLPAITHHSLPL